MKLFVLLNEKVFAKKTKINTRQRLTLAGDKVLGSPGGFQQLGGRHAEQLDDAGQLVPLVLGEETCQYRSRNFILLKFKNFNIF